MRGKRVVIAIVAILSLAGCAVTPQTDPVVEKIISHHVSGMTAQDSQPKGFCQPMEFSCSQPLWNIAFSGPASLRPEDVCRELIEIQKGFALTSYSQMGDPVGAAPADLGIVEKFCVAEMSTQLKDSAGALFYSTVNLFDDGSKDGMAKNVQLARTASGSYQLIYYVSRSPDRVTGIPATEGYVPKVLTQEEVDVANNSNMVAAKTQEFANTLIQMSEKDAIAAIEGAGYAWRVVTRDNKDMVVTSDYSPTRIGLYIYAGKIQDAITG